MGIRFACHVCEKQLNIKRELAGRRGVCPACSAKFRIPLQDAEKSTPIQNHGPTSNGTPPADDAENSTASSVTAAATGPRKASGQPTVSKNPPATTSTEAAQATASATLLDTETEATWYVRPPSGGQYGPASSEILKQWIDEGRVAATSLLWRDGWPQWRDAADVLPEMAARLPNGDVAARIPSLASEPKSAAIAETPKLSGDATVGSGRRVRSMRRVLLIGLLTALAATLIGLLVMIVNQK